MSKANQTPQQAQTSTVYKSLIGPDPTDDIQMPERSSQAGVIVDATQNAAARATKTESPERTALVYLVDGTSQTRDNRSWWEKMLGRAQSATNSSLVRGLNISDTSNFYYPKVCNPIDQVKYLYPLFDAPGRFGQIPAGSVVKVEYYDNYRRNIGLGGLLFPTGKIIEIIEPGLGVNNLCEFLKGTCIPPRPNPDGSATTSVQAACSNVGTLPFEKTLPPQHRTGANPSRGIVYPSHPLTGNPLPPETLPATTPQETRALLKKLGINSAMKASRTVMGETRGHKGADFVYGDGSKTATSPVKAVLDGNVYAIGTQKDAAGVVTGWGNWIILDHRPYYVTDDANGNTTDGPIFTVYAHLKDPFTRAARNILVKRGQKVSAGQQIAIGNSTGKSTGGHLHLEIVMERSFKGTPRS